MLGTASELRAAASKRFLSRMVEASQVDLAVANTTNTFAPAASHAENGEKHEAGWSSSGPSGARIGSVG